MIDMLIVTGRFSDHFRPSKIGEALAKPFMLDRLFSVTHVNGGTVNYLTQLVENGLTNYQVILWMPDVPNDEEKLLPLIKQKNPTALLISSKRAIEKTYTEFDVVGRLLKSRSNLGIMVTRANNRYYFSLLDPLGNLFWEGEDVTTLATKVLQRVCTLLQYQRIPSVKIGDAVQVELPPDYLEVIQDYGEKFHEYTNAVNPNRFLGNTSTRCMKGFPGIRTPHPEGHYAISRRNVDKTGISADDFVVVTSNEQQVEYFGDHKPSVDSPIQIRLFNYYRNVNFILHGHVYLAGVPTTPNALPCGSIEEFDEILDLVRNPEATNFAVNLKGHGCLILTDSVEALKGWQLHSRPFPEPLLV